MKCELLNRHILVIVLIKPLCVDEALPSIYNLFPSQQEKVYSEARCALNSSLTVMLASQINKLRNINEGTIYVL